jgi:hypothetical protein
MVPDTKWMTHWFSNVWEHGVSGPPTTSPRVSVVERAIRIPPWAQGMLPASVISPYSTMPRSEAPADSKSVFLSTLDKLMGKERVAALSVVQSLHEALQRDLDGVSPANSLLLLRSFMETHAGLSEPAGKRELPLSSAALLATDAAWFALLCNASYGARGALLFSAWRSEISKPDSPASPGLGVPEQVVGASIPAASAVASSETVAAEDVSTMVSAAFSSMFGKVQHAMSTISSAAWGDMAAFLKLSGLSEEDVLFANPTSEVHRPAHFLVVNHPLRQVVLVVRGTISEADIVTDAVARAVPFLDGAMSHEAMSIAAYRLYESVMSPDGMDLPSVMARHPGYRFVLTGHSLGGGVAALLHCLLHFHRQRSISQRKRVIELKGSSSETVPLEGVDLSCWCFGSPPVVTPLSAIPPEAQSSITQVVNGPDVVSRLCFHSLRRLAGALRTIDTLHPPSTIAEAIGAQKVERDDLGHVIPLALKAREEVEPDKHGEMLWLPGRVLWLPRPEDPQTPPSVFEIPTESLGDIVVTPHMVSSHVPTAYVVALNRLREAALADASPAIAVTP